MNFTAGDNAIVTTELHRVGDGATAKVGERVKILSVYDGRDCQIVSIESYSGAFMCDIVCFSAQEPLRITS